MSAAPGTEAPIRPSIRPLPALLVNQIAAGEVVERPASVVKELVENSLDAGATRIAVELGQGGIELIRISDDGCGIPAEQLPLALAPHATSKIQEAEDLDRIGTLGFRGEALASIASIARVTIRSRPSGETGAAVIEAEGATVGDVRPAAGPVGTSITVRNLFFNTPARRKFLRTTQTEQTRCVDAVRDLAMAHPGVAFTVNCDERSVINLPPGQSARERSIAVLGKELAEQVLEVQSDSFDDPRGIALWGLAGLPTIARATNQAQHLFLNGRVIRDKTIQHAIKEAYRGLIEPGRHPTCVLMLEMSPAAVDVNVHPAKTEVRFRDSGLVHSVVLRALRDALRGADLTPSLASALPRNAVLHAAHAPGSQAILPEPAAPSVGSFVDFFRRQTPQDYASRVFDFGSGGGQHGASAGSAASEATAPQPATPPQPVWDTPTPESKAGDIPLHRPIPAPRVLQIHNSYLITQDEQGVLIVDQHALHERVMFEGLLERIRTAPLESQRLLAPVVVPATERQIDKLSELSLLLERIGVEAAPLGPRAVGVQAFPTFLFDRGVDPLEFVTELLERAESEGFAPGGEQALHEVLDMMACKAAIKAGDRMSDHELAALVHLRETVERSSNCPHGRPTSVRLTIRELEKLFRRT